MLRIDDWSMAFLFTKIEDGTLALSDLTRQHNEIRPFFPRLILVGLALLGGYDAVQAMLFSWALICLVSWSLHLTGRRTLGDPRSALVLIVLANLLLFSLVNSPNWLWAVQIVMFLTLACLTGAIALACSGASLPAKFLGGIALASVATYSMSAGMLCWFVVLPVLVVMNRDQPALPRWTGVWIAAAAANLALYFNGYVRPDSLPSPWQALAHPFDLLHYVLVYLGGPFATGADRGVTARAAVVFAGALVVWASFVAVYLLRSDGRGGLRRRATPWIAVAGFSVASAVMAGVGRSGFGVHQALASRYATWALFLPIALLYLGALVLDDARRTRSAGSRRALVAAHGVVLLVFLSANLATSVRELPVLADSRERHLNARALLAFVNVAPEQQALERRVFPWLDRILTRVNALDRQGLLDPPLLRSDRVREIAGDPGGEPLHGAIDGGRVTPAEVAVRGWAFLPDRGEPAHAVLLCAEVEPDDPRVIAVTHEHRERPELVEQSGNGAYLRSGFVRRVPRDRIPDGATRLTAWAFDANDYRAYPLRGEIRLDAETDASP